MHTKIAYKWSIYNAGDDMYTFSPKLYTGRAPGLNDFFRCFDSTIFPMFCILFQYTLCCLHTRIACWSIYNAGDDTYWVHFLQNCKNRSNLLQLPRPLLILNNIHTRHTVNSIDMYYCGFWNLRCFDL